MSIIEPDARILAGRSAWRFVGRQRPEFALAPAEGQESVWDYPRPPRLEPVSARVRVLDGERLIAETQGAVRVLETAGAPTVYVPPNAVDEAQVRFGDVVSVCEWKGLAQEVLGVSGASIGWRYASVFAEFASILNWPSFYPNQVACWIDDERVRPQPGGYYGGWVTDHLVGPIKGEPGSGAW